MIVPVNVTFTSPDVSPWRALANTSSIGVALTLTGTGAVSTTVVYEVSNDFFATTGTTLAIAVLSGNDLVMETAQCAGAWAFARAKCTAISGTNASVQATLVTG